MEEIRRFTISLFSDLTIENFGDAKNMSADEVYSKAKNINLNAVRNNLSKHEIKHLIADFQTKLASENPILM